MPRNPSPWMKEFGGDENQYRTMNTFNAYQLIEERKWKELLKGLGPGEEHTFLFPTIENIKSCKAIGYDMNSDDTGRQYYFSVDKATRRVSITVKEEMKDDKH